MSFLASSTLSRPKLVARRQVLDEVMRLLELEARYNREPESLSAGVLRTEIAAHDALLAWMDSLAAVRDGWAA